MRGRLAFWLVVFAGWTVLVVAFGAASSLTYALNYQPPRWRYTLTMAATEWYVWAALTPLVAWLARRCRIVVLVLAGLPVAFVKVTLTRVLRGVTDRGENYFQISDLTTQYLIYVAIVAGTARAGSTIARRKAASCAPRSSRRCWPRHGCRCSACSSSRISCSTRSTPSPSSCTRNPRPPSA